MQCSQNLGTKCINMKQNKLNRVIDLSGPALQCGFLADMLQQFSLKGSRRQAGGHDVVQAGTLRQLRRTNASHLVMLDMLLVAATTHDSNAVSARYSNAISSTS